MQTKTLINLALEFPALEKSKRKALKGGSGGFQDTTGHWTFHGLSGGNWYNGGQSTMLNEVTIIGYRNPYDVTNSGSGGNSWWGNGSSGGNTGGGGDPILFNSQSLSGNLRPNNGSDTQVGGLCVFKSMEIVNYFFVEILVLLPLGFSTVKYITTQILLMVDLTSQLLNFIIFWGHISM